MKSIINLPQSSRTAAFVPRPPSTSEKELKSVLRNTGLKVTEQRMLILRRLYESNDRHVTAQQLYENVLEFDDTIGFATVYRLLRSLTDAGIMSETRMGGVSARYELTSKNHHDHLTCEHCGLICEFENEEIERLQAQVAGRFGFRLTHHVLELYGLCPACQSRSSK